MLFIKKGKLNRKGEAPIFLRFTVRGEKKELSTNQSIDPELWESGKGHIKHGVKDAAEKNQYLRNLVFKVQQCRRELMEEGVSITAQSILDRYNGADQESRNILDVFDEHNKKCEELALFFFTMDFFHSLNKYDVSYLENDLSYNNSISIEEFLMIRGIFNSHKKKLSA